MENDVIIVVTGLPRSGTSLMMQILQSMGIEIFTDNKRLPNESNPKGYFEHELVKMIEYDTSWVKEVEGKAIKIVSPLLAYLPNNHSYKIIFMDRVLDEIVQSQEKMLSVNNVPNPQIKPGVIKQIFIKDLKQAWSSIRELSHSESLEISHSKLLKKPDSELKKIKRFLNINVDLKNAINVIDEKLYRAKIN